MLTRRHILKTMPPLALAGVALAAFRRPARAATRTDAVMETVNYVAASLSGGQGSDAVTPFDKGMPGYDKLAAYFQALTDQARVHSDIEFVEETGSDAESLLTLRWTLDINAQVTGDLLERRVQEVHLRLTPAKIKELQWKIVAFEPIELFNPILRER